jgi:hypothetical protein
VPAYDVPRSTLPEPSSVPDASATQPVEPTIRRGQEVDCSAVGEEEGTLVLESCDAAHGSPVYGPTAATLPPDAVGAEGTGSGPVLSR